MRRHLILPEVYFRNSPHQPYGAPISADHHSGKHGTEHSTTHLYSIPVSHSSCSIVKKKSPPREKRCRTCLHLIPSGVKRRGQKTAIFNVLTFAIVGLKELIVVSVSPLMTRALWSCSSATRGLSGTASILGSIRPPPHG